MTTKQNLIEAATKKGYQVDQTLEEATDTVWIGISKGKGVWHWWVSLDGTTCFFDQSYSQNNGRTYKGSLRGIRLEMGMGLHSGASG